MFAGPRDWEAWLADHHDSDAAVWIRFAKKGSGLVSVTYPEALEVALCYGWIDGQVAKGDDKTYRQRFTRRRGRSKWSQINRGKAEALIEAGRMKPSGLREVEAARQDGRWDAAYPSPRAIAPPPDLLEALRANPQAEAVFQTLKKQERYSILYKIYDARRPETRARRIQEFIAAARQIRKPALRAPRERMRPNDRRPG
jgi:uncharacterized protein YdeI (YjbR/CyaY-like superfamily)